MSKIEKDRNTGGHGYLTQGGEITSSFSLIFDAREALLRYFVIDYVTQDVDSFLVGVVLYTRKHLPKLF